MAGIYFPNLVPGPIYQKTFTVTVATSNPDDFVLYPYNKTVVIVLDNISFVGGTAPTLQIDYLNVFPDGSVIDFANTGARAAGAFDIVALGNVVGASAPIVPQVMQLFANVAGAPTSCTFRLTIYNQG